MISKLYWNGNLFSIKAALVIMAVLVLPLAAQATSTVYNVTATYQEGTSTGTFTLNSNYKITDASFEFTDGSNSTSYSCSSCALYLSANDQLLYFEFNDVPGDTPTGIAFTWPEPFSLTSPPTSFSSFTSDGSYIWTPYLTGRDYLVSGTATDAPPGPGAQTPEPGTWILLASGLVALAIVRARSRLGIFGIR